MSSHANHPDRPCAALVTGASKGLGLALARALAERGWSLIIDARHTDALETARRELAAKTVVVAIAGTITDPAHRRELAAAAARLGALDAVVNNAGSLGPSPLPRLVDLDGDAFVDLLGTNVVAPLELVQSVYAHLAPGARILNVSSDAAVKAYPSWGAYGASKAALEQWTAVFAAENPHLRVYRVDPGDMRTDMHQAAFPGEDIGDRPLPEASVPGLLELLTGDVPSGRVLARGLASSATASPIEV